MNNVEDRLRAATRAAACTVADNSAPPLHLPPGSHRPATAGRAGRIRIRHARWGVPLAAAASVAAVVAASILAGGVVTAGHHLGHAGPPSQPRSAPRVDGLPAYFLTETGRQAAPGGRSAGIRATMLDIVVTATGKVAATATVPGKATSFAADGAGSFYAAVNSGSATTFYEIRLPASGTAAIVTRLPIKAIPELTGFGRPVSAVADIAAAPDGSDLAITIMVTRGNMGLIQNLIVASAKTGAEHRWTISAPDSGGSLGPISWLADSRTLALNWLGYDSAVPSSLRLLDTTRSGSDPLTGRDVLALNREQFSDFTISQDGRILIGIANHPKSAVEVHGRTAAEGSVVEFSARTGRARILYEPPAVWDKATGQAVSGSCNDPLWMSNSGRQVLLMCIRPMPRGHAFEAVASAVLLDGGAVLRLPWLNRLAPSILAFGS